MILVILWLSAIAFCVLAFFGGAFALGGLSDDDAAMAVMGVFLFICSVLLAIGQFAIIAAL